MKDKYRRGSLGLAMIAGTVYLAVAGCGSGDNVVAVTPVMADAKGTYRLASTYVAAAGGAAASFVSYSTGTLRISDDGTYQRSVGLADQKTTDGLYFFGPSPTTITATTILNSREGAFVLSSTDPAQPFRGSYLVNGDLILMLRYPDQGGGARTNTWVKISDSPRQ